MHAMASTSRPEPYKIIWQILVCFLIRRGTGVGQEREGRGKDHERSWKKILRGAFMELLGIGGQVGDQNKVVEVLQAIA